MDDREWVKWGWAINRIINLHLEHSQPLSNYTDADFKVSKTCNIIYLYSVVDGFDLNCPRQVQLVSTIFVLAAADRK